MLTSEPDDCSTLSGRSRIQKSLPLSIDNRLFRADCPIAGSVRRSQLETLSGSQTQVGNHISVRFGIDHGTQCVRHPYGDHRGTNIEKRIWPTAAAIKWPHVFDILREHKCITKRFFSAVPVTMNGLLAGNFRQAMGRKIRIGLKLGHHRFRFVDIADKGQINRGLVSPLLLLNGFPSSM